MKVYLLYAQKEWEGQNRYFDYQSVIKDLGLEILFRTASREQMVREGAVQRILEADFFLEETMNQVMMVPLETAAEVSYRQDILKDCIANKDFISELYDFADETIFQWNKLGRKLDQKVNSREVGANLVSRVHVLQLFVARLRVLKEMLSCYETKLISEGLCSFIKRMQIDFSDELQADLEKILEDLAFYSENQNEQIPGAGTGSQFKNAKIVLQCGITEGLKFNPMKLESVETTGKRNSKKKRKKTMLERYLGAFASEPTVLLKEDILLGETKKLEYQIVDYLVSCCDGFVDECRKFFEQLHIQTAFYRAAFNLNQRLVRNELPYCFPTVGNKESLTFDKLIDAGMAIEQTVMPVGNSVDINKKMLLVVTGANQGGKSTFLRSIGIAQIMMQCGLFVTAEHFESGLYPCFFTHFTRREDSEMNSGRLDEELNRMSRIVKHLGKDSIVLLNESFATTTEKEGSIIAYDIIRALIEADVKVLTVTHLLSFARKLYREMDTNVEFLSAERKEDGSRTYKMIQTAPELTSFGLDLYDQIVK